MGSQNIPRLLTTKEVAQILHVNRVTVLKLIHKGDLPAIRIGTSDYRISESDLVEFIEKSRYGRRCE